MQFHYISIGASSSQSDHSRNLRNILFNSINRFLSGMEIRKIIFVLSQENSLSFCSECLFQLEPNVGCAVFLPSKLVHCLDCYLNFKKKNAHLNFSNISIICSSDFYKSYNCFLDEFGVWEPEEELAMLEAVEKHGFGNWADVTYVSAKPATIYENHYLKFYVDHPFIFELDEFAKIKSSISKTRKFYLDSADVISCISSSCSDDALALKTEIKEEPLDWYSSSSAASVSCKKKDPSDVSVGSSTKSHEHCNCPEELKSFSKSQAKLTPLAAGTGYCSRRDEFNVYPFNNAELSLSIINDLSDCSVPDLPLSKISMINDSNLLMNCLSYTLIENYNHVLRRRERLKKFAKEYHLLYNQNAFSWLKQYQITLNKDIVTHLSRVLQFISKGDAKAILNNLKQIDDLKAKLQDLKYYRVKGLQTFKEVELFRYLKQERKKKLMKPLDNIAPLNNDYFMQVNLKRFALPLDIEILPGYDKLLDDEKELCASARIIPSSYEQFKSLMVTECQKANGLRLAQARRLMKICVNRTRRIYDFLLEKGLVWLPAS